MCLCVSNIDLFLCGYVCLEEMDIGQRGEFLKMFNEHISFKLFDWLHRRNLLPAESHAEVVSTSTLKVLKLILTHNWLEWYLKLSPLYLLVSPIVLYLCASPLCFRVTLNLTTLRVSQSEKSGNHPENM